MKRIILFFDPGIIILTLTIFISFNVWAKEIYQRADFEERIISALKENDINSANYYLTKLENIGNGTLEENNNVLFFKALVAQKEERTVDAILIYQDLLKKISSQDYGTKSKVLHNLSTIYMELYQIEAATDYIKKAKFQIWKTNDELSKGKISLQLSDYYFIQGQYTLALNASEDAVLAFRKIHLRDYELAAKIRYEFLNVFLKKNLAEKEIDEILKRLPEIEKGEAGKVTRTTAYINLAIVLISNDYKLDEAKELLDGYTPICHELHLDLLISTAYEGYSQLYEKKGNLMQSLIYTRKKSEIQNKINIQGNTLKLNGLKVLHQIEEQETKVKYLHKEMKYNRLWIMFLVACIALVIVTALYVYIVVRRRLKKTKAELLTQNLALENEKLLTRNLEVENELKKRELLGNTMLINQKNELLERIDNIISPVLKKYEVEELNDVKTFFNSVKSEIRSDSYIENNWNNFVIHFEQVHPGFFKILKNKFPNLTSNDLRHCAYIKMNLSRKEISMMMNINIEAVKMVRNRIKKKMNLTSEESLNEVLNNS